MPHTLDHPKSMLLALELELQVLVVELMLRVLVAALVQLPC
jgi:hypothetical protein